MKKIAVTIAAIATFSVTSLSAAGQHSSTSSQGPKISHSEIAVTTFQQAERSYRQASAAIASPKSRKVDTELKQFTKLQLHKIERQESRARQLRG